MIQTLEMWEQLIIMTMKIFLILNSFEYYIFIYKKYIYCNFFFFYILLRYGIFFNFFTKDFISILQKKMLP